VNAELLRAPHVADGLLDAAQHASAQLIVLGTHGLAPLTRLRLGGTAMRVLHATELPLVLVPPTAH
jgi:nucleotide-binding universal stress UspA family protein